MISNDSISDRELLLDPQGSNAAWADCRFLTCSVLPVRMACNLSCKFCFSKSSISALRQDQGHWTERQLQSYYEVAVQRGARRLVVTGGGEPLLRAGAVREAIRIGLRYFQEIALFTNGSYLDRELAQALSDDGLSYVCFSRHHFDDGANRELMGKSAIALEQFFSRIAGVLKVRATCVLCRGFIDDARDVEMYIERLSQHGVREFTFKHTYVAYKKSVFGDSSHNRWVEQNQIQDDPFAGRGEVLARLPWGPEIKRIGGMQLCYYYEPTPKWELNHRLCRSINLLADGGIYASLEDQQSRLFRLNR